MVEPDSPQLLPQQYFDKRVQCSHWKPVENYVGEMFCQEQNKPDNIDRCVSRGIPGCL